MTTTTVMISGTALHVDRIKHYGRCFAGGEFLGCVRKNLLTGKYTAGRGDSQNPAMAYEAGREFSTAKKAVEWLAYLAVDKGLLVKTVDARRPGYVFWTGAAFMARLDVAKAALLTDERPDFHPSWFSVYRIAA